MAWHNFKNVGEGPGKLVTVHSPAVMEDFVREVGRKIDDPDDPPEPEGPPSEEELSPMMEIVQKYMEVLPPDKMPKETQR